MSQEQRIVPGLRAEISLVVDKEDTASHLGSGHVAVLATPRMISLMERASVLAVDHLLPQGQATVGGEISVRHLAPTPLGMKVRAHAELMKVEGKKLSFCVEAFDEVERVGEGTHVRFIIDLARFKERTKKL